MFPQVAGAFPTFFCLSGAVKKLKILKRVTKTVNNYQMTNNLIDETNLILLKFTTYFNLEILKVSVWGCKLL